MQFFAIFANSSSSPCAFPKQTVSSWSLHHSRKEQEHFAMLMESYCLFGTRTGLRMPLLWGKGVKGEGELLTNGLRS